MALKTSRKITLSVAGALAICALALAMVAQRINVVIEEPVNLYDKPMGGQVIKKLKPGEVASVVGCEDLKHYIVPVVSVDGKKGYVLEGKYHLDRRKVWELSAAPLSFSCP